jgi:hypothetical protein
MIVDCRDLEHALASDDPSLREAMRLHSQTCSACRAEIERDNALSAAARTLHRDWDTPRLWRQASARMSAEDQLGSERASRWHVSRFFTAWQPAAAAVVVIALASATWLGWRALKTSGPSSGSGAAARLLSEEALTEIERSEAQYVRSIDELTRLAAPKLEMPDSPLLLNLRDRLHEIDAAIAEYRDEIARNRFNAHLRRQLLWIYQEKRRTLEQVQESSTDAI